jgi:hypothetical protein
MTSVGVIEEKKDKEKYLKRLRTLKGFSSSRHTLWSFALNFVLQLFCHSFDQAAVVLVVSVVPFDSTVRPIHVVGSNKLLPTRRRHVDMIFLGSGTLVELGLPQRAVFRRLEVVYLRLGPEQASSLASSGLLECLL